MTMTPPAQPAGTADIDAAVGEAFAAADYKPVGPDLSSPRLQRPMVRPVPLDAILGAFPLRRIEVPQLTRQAAATELRAWGVEPPAILNDGTPLAGLLFVTTTGGLILVRRDDPLVRRRFSAAHELGHFLLHFRPETLDELAPDAVHDDAPQAMADAAGDGDVTSATSAAALLDQREREANQFAAELLMPVTLCRAVFNFYTQRYGETPQFIESHMAGDLLVSRQAIRRRLLDLRLTTAAGGESERPA